MRYCKSLPRFLDALIARLTDPARRERWMLGVLAPYVTIWTLYAVLAKSNQDVHYDSAEVVAWSREPSLGYAKHPPLAAWLIRVWFSAMPVADWSYYLFAMLSAAIALWLSWRLFAHYLDPERRVIGVALLMLTPFFNFHALRFDHTTVLIPLWAATTLAFLRAFSTRSIAWSVLAGITAALAMLGKYWSVFLLLGLGLAAVSHPMRARYFRSHSPYITIVSGSLLLVPHLYWLIANDFIPIGYAVASRTLNSISAAISSVFGYLIGGAGYVACATLLLLGLTRPDAAAISDTILPRSSDRRFVSIAFWLPLLLPVAVALASGLELNSTWTMPGLTLLPIVLLSSPLLNIDRTAVRGIVLVAAAFPILMVLVAPSLAMLMHWHGLSPTAAHGKLLAAQIEQEWKRATGAPLRLVGGDLDLAYLTAFYLPSHPSTYLAAEPELSPWVDDARLDRDGIVLICHARDNLGEGETCVHKPVIDAITAIAAPRRGIRTIVVESTRRLFGVAGKSARYIVVTVPPQR
jgi:4-amino-4-deoxy-L-arabinose transferase-like glycosyltransferase